MKKYQITINFTMDDDFMSYVPEHRVYINGLIVRHIIDYYTVSLESFTCWILINARSKKEAKAIVIKSVLSSYWHNIVVDELFVYDSSSYRLPELVLN
jgi:hypothetical protein